MSDLNAGDPQSVNPVPYDQKLSQGYTRAEWEALDPLVQNRWAEREKASRANREDQTRRLYQKIESLESRLNSQPQAQAPETEKPAGLEGMSLGEVEQTLNHAQGLLIRARQEPDNAQLQAEAARVTPEALTALQRQQAKLLAAEAVSGVKQDFDARDKSRQAEAALHGRIAQDFGANAVMAGDPVHDRALEIYQELQGMGEGALTYAAFKAANGEVSNRGGPTGGSLANEDEARSRARVEAEIAALSRKGDHAGAFEKGLDAWIAGSPAITRAKQIQELNGLR